MKILVVGGVHHDMQEAKDSEVLKAGSELRLIREPENRYDKNAIAVFCGEVPLQIGYVAKNKANTLAERIDGGAAIRSCKATKIYTSSLEAELEFEEEANAEE